MRNQLLLTALLSLSALQAIHAQAPADLPQKIAFEIASVKQNVSGSGNSIINSRPGGRFEATNASLRSLVRAAYALQDFQVGDLPSWTEMRSYDIVAKADKEITYDEGRLMLRSLLAERFGLVVHPETRELPIYALVMARSDGKLGPQMAKAQSDCTDPTAPKPAAPRPIPCGAATNTTNGSARMRAGSIPMAYLVPALSGFVNRIVVDRTGLTGAYDATLTWSITQAADTTGASIFTALQEQLGLKLESTRGPVDVLVIDHVEPPTPD